MIWFDFKSLCDGTRSQNDYLELARAHHTLLLSGIPEMSPKMASAARRFTWLVDVLYDHKVKFIVTAACQPEALYPVGAQAGVHAHHQPARCARASIWRFRISPDALRRRIVYHER